MIKSKKDLKEYLKADFEVNKIERPLLQWISKGELFCVYNFLNTLRHLEYYKNTPKSIFKKIPYAWYKWNHRRLKLKYEFYFEPNTIGKGLSILHPGFRRIGVYMKIGDNVTFLPNVLIGKKAPNVDVTNFKIGNNCYFGYGATVSGPVTIGDNVTVGAGTVITKDLPSNCVVVGNPAKIIKQW